MEENGNSDVRENGNETEVLSGGSRICKRGAKVERRRREYRGAKG